MINLGVLGSTNGTDLQPILDAIETGKLDAKVSVVISNREDAYILERAKKHNTPNVFINHKGKVREDFDSEMTNILKKHNVDLILLIGFKINYFIRTLNFLEINFLCLFLLIYSINVSFIRRSNKI